MTRESIEQAAEAKSEAVSDHGWWRESDAIDFALSQVRLAFEEAAKIILEMRREYLHHNIVLPLTHRLVEAIRAAAPKE